MGTAFIKRFPSKSISICISDILAEFYLMKSFVGLSEYVL